MDTSTLINSSRHTLRLLEKRAASRWRLTTLWRIDSDATIQRSLLRLLAVAHRERLDLVALIHNFADEHRGMWQFRLHRLARRLEAGMSLVDALEQTPDALSPSQTLAIRFATQSGTLPAIFDQLVKQPFNEQLVARAAIHRSVGYGITLIIFLALIATFLNMFIIPTLEKMSEEFGIRPPWSMLKYIEFSQSIARLGMVGFLLFWVVVLLSAFAPVRRITLRRLSNLWTRVSTQRRSSELLRLLSTAVAAGRPISGSLSILARYHFDKVIRNRLLFARNEVEFGAEPWECLERAKFISRAEADAIRGAWDSRMQAWTLAQIATVKSARVTHRFEKLAALSRPAVVLTISAVVLWIAVSFTQHLYQLVHSLV